MHDTVRFILGGRIEEVRGCAPTDTVLDFLRSRPGLRGTKEGCAEGDCGACTVVLGELHEGAVRYRAVNACIQFLPMLDGKLLLTVEDLQDAGGAPHPVQQAMVDCHGSQCGFCTPGFVMSLFALHHDRPDSAPARPEIDLALAGNLCRCTGYAPIVRAARQSLPAGRRDRFDENEADWVALLESVRPDDMLATGGPGGRFFAPGDADELARVLAEHPDATLVAGATDVGLWVTKQLRELPTLVYTGRVNELLRVERDEAAGCLSIGAAVTYSDALDALCEVAPAFRELIERLGGWQVRNAGTVGGNIANGSPIGDMPPGLIALGARLVLRGADGTRTLALEDFFLDYGKQDLREGEFVERVLLPIPEPALVFRTYKLSKRFEQDISAVCAGFGLTLADGRIANARVCFGGMAPTPRRAPACERALTGRPWDESTVQGAMRALDGDYTPIDDFRASAAYRLQVARNLLWRCWLESQERPHPVRLAQRHG